MWVAVVLAVAALASLVVAVLTQSGAPTLPVPAVAATDGPLFVIGLVAAIMVISSRAGGLLRRGRIVSYVEFRRFVVGATPIPLIVVAYVFSVAGAMMFILAFGHAPDGGQASPRVQTQLLTGWFTIALAFEAAVTWSVRRPREPLADYRSRTSGRSASP